MSLKNWQIASYSLCFPPNSEKFYLIFLSRPTHAKLSNKINPAVSFKQKFAEMSRFSSSPSNQKNYQAWP
jgi:hypothetical protein